MNISLFKTADVSQTGIGLFQTYGVLNERESAYFRLLMYFVTEGKYKAITR